jgi:hypothetical protein
VIGVEDVHLHSRVGRAQRPPHITTRRSPDSACESDRASVGRLPGRHRRAHANAVTRHAVIIAILLAAAMAGFATAHVLASSNLPEQTAICSETCAPSATTAPPRVGMTQQLTRADSLDPATGRRS